MATETWRERDLRGKHGPVPRSVSSVVLRVHAALSLAQAGESILFFVAGFAITQAAVASSNGNTGEREALVLGGLMGCLAAASWWRVHRSDPRAIARELDRRLRHDGGLLTAFELEGGTQPVTGGGAIGSLLITRVLHRLRLSEALRTMFPPLMIPIAAPLIGLGLLVLALEEDTEGERATAGWGALATGMLGAFDGLEDAVLEANETGALRSADLGRLLRAVNNGRSIERRQEALAADAEACEAGARELADLGSDLAELAARSSGGGEESLEKRLADRIEEARNWVEAARMGLEAGVGKSARQRGETGENPGAGAGSAGEAVASAGSSPVTGLTKNGTMAGSAIDADRSPPEDSAGSNPVDEERIGMDEAGTLAADYWPPAYDGVISGWIELTRKRKESRAR